MEMGREPSSRTPVPTTYRRLAGSPVSVMASTVAMVQRLVDAFGVQR